jgi:hypothetical protein
MSIPLAAALIMTRHSEDRQCGAILLHTRTPSSASPTERESSEEGIVTSAETKDSLIAALDRSVDETLSYFEGPGQTSRARVDRWGAWEVLAHFPYWHFATAWGILSASAGGPPWQLSGNADETNVACLALREGESFTELTAELRRAQQRLARAAQACDKLDAPAFRMADGRLVSGAQRLETIARHWSGHLQALRDA